MKKVKTKKVNTHPKHLMKTLRHNIGPANAAFLAITGFSSFAILLRPTLVELLMYFGADFVGGILSFLFDPTLFKRFRPEYSVVLSELTADDFKNASREDRAELLRKVISFPRVRSDYNATVGLVKLIPAAVTGIFFIDALTSATARALVMIPALALTVSFFYIANYYDYHRYLTHFLNNVLKEVDLTQAFSDLQLDHERQRFARTQAIGIALIVAFSLGLNFLVNYSHTSDNELLQAFWSSGIGLVGMLLFLRAWYMSKALTLDSLWEIMIDLAEVKLGELPQLHRINTVPAIAKLQQTIIGMKIRLKDSEDVLSSYMQQEAETERYRLLGELTALIAHDLSAPLHTASFFTNELRANTSLDSKGVNYIDRIHKNLDGATKLLLSMRYRLKEENEEVKATSVAKTHEEVLRFLSMQYPAENFSKIKISFEGDSDIAVATSNVDLVQILDNLYRNAVSELISSETAQPELRIRVEKGNDSEAHILVSDNGRGMSPQQFDSLTATISAVKSTQNSRSLGLRLTRRLIEKHKGSLNILTDSVSRGATFVVKLPLNNEQVFHLNPFPRPANEAKEIR